ncbi:hypothetical protein BUALT_Bualt01G0224200 [Buddleja alternifolia]|uniref:Histone H2A/H2B/H3 domain-containing protein n=1 Tax=Buddleja alternifolia TaxID=168488 RepID=A0AAV6Y9D4_9LAMI|nr:hypothetical protein BUALT_Bualt01G0224200 [Buddleja alternifolia]
MNFRALDCFLCTVITKLRDWIFSSLPGPNFRSHTYWMSKKLVKDSKKRTRKRKSSCCARGANSVISEGGSSSIDGIAVNGNGVNSGVKKNEREIRFPSSFSSSPLSVKSMEIRDLTRHWTGEEDIRAITKEACSELLAYFAECMISGETLWRNAVMQRRTGDQKRRACKLQVSGYYQKVLADLINLLLVIYRKPIPEKIFYGLDDIKEACIIIVITTVQLTSGENRSLCQVGKGTLSEDGIGLPGGTIKCFAS